MDNIKILIFIIGVLTIFISESTTAKSSTRHRVTLKNTVVEDPKLQNASASTGSGSNSTSPGNFTSIELLSERRNSSTWKASPISSKKKGETSKKRKFRRQHQSKIANADFASSQPRSLTINCNHRTKYSKQRMGSVRTIKKFRKCQHHRCHRHRSAQPKSKLPSLESEDLAVIKTNYTK